jgi:hypothetical protein
MRGLANRRLAVELGKLHAAGTRTLVLQPTAADLQVMGWNFMARGRRVEVVESAVRTTALTLRRLRRSEQLMPGRSTRRLAPVPAAAARAAAA